MRSIAMNISTIGGRYLFEEQLRKTIQKTRSIGPQLPPA